MWASYNDHLDVVKALMAAGIDRDAKDNVGFVARRVRRG